MTIYTIKRMGPTHLSPTSRTVRELAMVVAMNYERRARGEAKDRWHWADLLLMATGYCVVPSNVYPIKRGASDDNEDAQGDRTQGVDRRSGERHRQGVQRHQREQAADRR